MKKILLGLGLVGSLYAQTFTKSLDSIGWHSVGVPLDNIEVNSTTFSDNISVVWRWNGLTQSWEFYSNNDSLKELAQSISVPVITSLNKGDAIWVKNNITTSISLDDGKEFVPNGSCTEEVQGIDTRVVKIGSVGQILSDESEEWSGIWYKDPDLNLMVAFDRTPAGFTSTKSQSSAREYCTELNFLSFNDWKLPSNEETEMMNYYFDINLTSKYKYENIGNTYLWTNDKEYEYYNKTYYQYFKLSSSNISRVGGYSDSGGSYSKNFLCVRKAD